MDRVLAEHLEASDLQITRWQLGQERPDSPAVLSLALDHLLEQGQEPDNDCRRRDWEPVVHRASGGTGGQTVQPDFPTEDLRVLGLAKGLRDPSVFRLLAQEGEEEALAEKLKASVRAKVEHPS